MTDEQRFGGGDESRVQALMAENERLKKAWAKDNVCGICPYRKSFLAEVERLRKQNDSLAGRLQRTEALLRRYVSGKVTRA